MATIISDAIKAELRSRGIWGDFVRKREDVVMAKGLSTNAAAREVLGEIAPDLCPEVKRRGRPKSEDCKESVKKQEQKPQVPMASLADRKLAARDAKAAKESSNGSQVQESHDDLVDEKMFDGRSCTKGVAYEWAFSHQFVKGVRPDDAPSLYAWSLYCFFRKSVSAMVDISKQCLSVSIRKEAETEDTGDRFDGEDAYDLAGIVARGGAEG